MMPPGISPGEFPPFYKLNEYVFQDLCRDLFDKECGIAMCEVYGVRGQSQYGIDLLAHREENDGIEVGQCKRLPKFTPSRIREVSNEFFENWDHWHKKNVKRFILFVACDLSKTQQQDEILKQRKRFKKYGINYEAWSAATIRNRLRPYPEIVKTYCEPADYWAHVICGSPAPTFLSKGIQEQQNYPVVQAVLADQIEKLGALISGDTEQKIKKIQAVWREGIRNQAIK